jgi:hypothetical protein
LVGSKPPECFHAADPGQLDVHQDERGLYRRTDNPEQAQEHLTTAGTMYGEMGMTYWSEKLEKG